MRKIEFKNDKKTREFKNEKLKELVHSILTMCLFVSQRSIILMRIDDLMEDPDYMEFFEFKKDGDIINIHLTEKYASETVSKERLIGSINLKAFECNV